MTRSAKPVPMCCISINYSSYLMPADVGMKLVALMNHAVECSQDYNDAGRRYKVKDAPEVQYASVRPDQVIFPPDVAATGARRLK